MKKLVLMVSLLASMSAIADETKGIYDFCVNIMPEMARTSGLQNITLFPDGYRSSSIEGELHVYCKYNAAPVVPGPNSTIIFAAVNVETGKISFEVI